MPNAGSRRKHHLRDVIASIKAGISLNGEDRPAEAGERGILKLSAVTGGNFSPSENKAITVPRLDAPSPKKGSLIVSRSNTAQLVGTVAYVESDYPSLFLPDLLWLVKMRDDAECDGKWLSYYLSSPSMRKEILAKASGTSGSMKKLSMAAFRSIEVQIPPLKIQQKCANILAQWDLTIGKIVSLLAGKNRLKRALMLQLLTGKQRLPGHKGAWKCYHLGQLFDERSESGRGDLPLLSITGDRGLIPRAEIEGKDSSPEDKSKYKRIAPGDIGYNTMRMWQGVSAVSRLEGIISPAYTVCIPRETAHAEFMGYLFKFPPVVHAFHRHSQGLVNDTLNLKFPHFAQVQVTVPSVSEQAAIARVLSTCDRELTLLKRQLDLFKLQKRGLMQKLLAGEIRVKV